MRALTIAPGQRDSIRLDERPDPLPDPDCALVEALALGVCGTDMEIIHGDYGWAPPGENRLILGHESLGRVLEAPPGSNLKAGDMVVGIVRRPDPVPCPACGAGEWDMCRNGLYTERGIKQRHGYGAERWLIEPDFAIKIDPTLGILGVLLEPTSVVAKAWDHIERIGARTQSWRPERVLVTGGGPVGLLAAMIGRQKGLENPCVRPQRYRSEARPDHRPGRDAAWRRHRQPQGPRPDRGDRMHRRGPGGDGRDRRPGHDAILCLAGVSSGGRKVDFDVGGFNRQAVLGNDVVFGSVNANRAHYQAAADALAKADRGWLERLITRRVPLDRWREAFNRQEDDVKVVIDFGKLE
ncbi:MAG: alcohol dehydrogenase catalytic domain-containing protein [Caulobacteraceae bacterium]